MALMTACPQCQTQFKIVPDQLRLHNGLVRCGACNHVFDASKVLLTVPTLTPAVPSDQDEPVWKNKAVVQALMTPPSDSLPPTSPPPTPPSPESTADAQAERRKQLAHNDWLALHQTQPPAPTGRSALAKMLLWVTVISLLCAATVQALLIGRFALVSALPLSEPLLTPLCSLFKCAVQPARTLQPLTLESLTLKRISSPDHLTEPASYELQTHISNTGRLTVWVPMLELTLTNAQTKVIARRVLTSAELGAAAAATIAPQSEWHVKINVRLDPQTAGFTGRLIGSSRDMP